MARYILINNIPFKYKPRKESVYVFQQLHRVGQLLGSFICALSFALVTHSSKKRLGKGSLLLSGGSQLDSFHLDRYSEIDHSISTSLQNKFHSISTEV